MTLDWARIGAVVRKELREFRRNRFIIGTMAVLPVVFLITPVLTIFRISSTEPAVLVQRQVGITMFILLIVPVILPATIASYSVVGERDQGTLEPLLTTPIRREELIIGKGLAVFVPAIVMSYFLFFVFAISARLFAAHAVGVAVWRSSQLFAHLVFIPLLAVWAIWVCLAVSARASDVRVAQQLGTLASLPPLAVVSLFAFQVINPTFALAAGLAVALAVIDLFGWRLVSQVFDRERLISGGGRAPGRSRAAAPP